jgi:hypothetical protein
MAGNRPAQLRYDELKDSGFFAHCEDVSTNHRDPPAEMIAFDYLVQHFKNVYEDTSTYSSAFLEWSSLKGYLEEKLSEATKESLHQSGKSAAEVRFDPSSTRITHERFVGLAKALVELEKHSSFLKSDVAGRINGLFKEASLRAFPQVNKAGEHQIVRLSQKGKDGLLMLGVRRQPVPEGRARSARNEEPNDLDAASNGITAEVGYTELIQYVKKHGAKKVVLIQLAAMKSGSLIDQLLRIGCQVELHISDARLFREYAINAGQIVNLGQRPAVLLGDLGNRHGVDVRLLQLYIYDVPPSICGVKIDEDLLMLSWYHCSYGDDEREPYVIEGHNSPAFFVKAGDPGFEPFKKMFDDQAKNFRDHRARQHSPARTRRRPENSPYEFLQKQNLVKDDKGGIIRASASRTLVFPEAKNAYFAITNYIAHVADIGEGTQSATLVQHSGTYGDTLITKLEELRVPMKVFHQSVATIRRVLGESGVMVHYASQKQNNRANRYKERPTDIIFSEPIFTLSAVWVEQGEADSFLFLSRYIYLTFAGCQTAHQRGLFGTQELMTCIDADPRVVNKIWGHNQPGVIFFSADEHGAPDEGYRCMAEYFRRFIELLDVDNEVNPSEEEKLKREGGPHAALPNAPLRGKK